MRAEPLDTVQFDAASLLASHPPRWQHPNKQAVFDLVRSSGSAFAGQLVCSRWPEQPLPRLVPAPADVRIVAGVFTYPEPAGGAHGEWHMNFADPHVFVAYGSPLLAQDELQVLEHPILGSLREALDAAGHSAQTVDARGRPTPITVSGVQRHCALDTLPAPAAGRPRGLYGNAFARASTAQVAAATRLMSPPTTSHILAIAAPGGGYGDYSPAEIAYVATAAYTGFLAARWTSDRVGASASRTRIHTGFWGCGAFGGNRVLMTLLQLLAAQLAGVDLVFHALDETGVATAEEARERYVRMTSSTSSVPEILEAVARERFQWGESDGN
jgi:hypothetical protein